MKLQLKKASSGEVNLTEGSILKGIVYFSIPLLLSSLLQQFYNTADLMIVGKFAGKNPMAAVGASGALSNLLIGLFLGLTTGASVVVSQVYGHGDRQEIKDTVHTAYAVAIVGGIIISIIGVIVAPIILGFLNTPDEILGHAVTYMRILFLGMTPTLVFNMGSGILRAIGDSRRPFNFLCVAAAINIVLDLIFVIVLKLSVLGVGIATFIAQTTSAILVTYNLMKSERAFKLNLNEIKFHKHIVTRVFKIGIPTGIQSSVISFSNVIIQSKINLFGASAIAGYAAQERLDGFIFMSLNALSLAATTFSGQNIGAGKVERLKSGVRLSLALSLVISITLSVLGRVFIVELMGIFSNEPDVIEVGATAFKYLSAGYFIFGMSEIFGGFVRGAGYAVPPMVISVLSMCILRLVWIFVALNIWFKIEIIFLSYPISWTVTFLLNFLYYKFGNWKNAVKEVA
jgi:putative MATE family efflux protein